MIKVKAVPAETGRTDTKGAYWGVQMSSTIRQAILATFTGAIFAALGIAAAEARPSTTRNDNSAVSSDFSAEKRQQGGGRPQQRAQQPRQQQRIQQPRVQQPQRQQHQRVQQHQRQQQQRVQKQQRQPQQQRVQKDQRQQQQKQRHDQNKAQQKQRQDQIKAQQQQRKEQQQKAKHDRDQQRQDRQKAQQQQRQDRQKDRQDRQKAQQGGRDNQAQKLNREDRRKQQSQQRQKDRQAHQRDRQQKKIDNRIARDKARNDRAKQRADRRQTDKLADMKKAKDRADRRIQNKISRDVARNGRFAARFANRNFARVRFARWSPDRAWRRGLLAGFVPWGIGLGIGGAVFWPYAYADMFNYTFWPSGYYGGYWAYAYDDFFDGIWWAGEPSYASEALPYQQVSSAPAPLAGTSAPVAGGRPQLQSQTASQDRPQTAATAGEGACGETGRGVTAWPFDRMQASLRLSDDQQDLMSDLRDAAVQAAEAMRDSCPRTQPRSPLERLQAMTDRLEATLEALKIVRPPLEKFYDSLSSDQRRRFDELGPKIADPDAQRAARPGQSSACGEDKPGLANFPIEKIQEAVSPNDDQLDLLDKLEDATFRAVDIMKAACPDDPPATPSARLAATQSRVEAMIEAAKVLQPALEDFYTALSDQQKARFNNMKS